MSYLFFFKTFFAFFLLVFVLFFSFLSCQQKETQVFSSSIVDSTKGDLLEPSSLVKKSLIVDGRSFFEYKVSRFPGAIHKNWKDFFSWKDQKPFLSLRSDLRLELRKLARLGIQPRSPILIYGNGKGGKGREWTLAWVFLYLNFKNIRVVSVDKMKEAKSFVNESFDFSSQERKPVDFWEPTYNKSLIADESEINSLLKRFQPQKKNKVLKGKNKTLKKFNFWFIDLSGKKSLKGGQKEKWFNQKWTQKKVLHFYWKDFLYSKDRASKKLRKKLLKKGIFLEDRIFVLGENQGQSLAFTAYLYLMGFKNVASFSREKKTFLSLINFLSGKDL